MIGNKIIELQKVDSTNFYLEEEYSKNTIEEGTIIIAREQFAGKGQDSNSWHSAPGDNLTLSILLKPQFLNPANQFSLNEMVSLAVTEAIEKFLPEEAKIHIKWPNDIYVGDRKVAGILIKNFISGRILDASIVGIGINVNQKKFPASIPNAISISMVAGISIEIKEVFKALVESFTFWYKKLNSEDCSDISINYMLNLYRRTGYFPYLFKGNKIIAKITGLDEYGRLILESDSGEICCCDLKDVKFLL